jgi:hypothetical protein
VILFPHFSKNNMADSVSRNSIFYRKFFLLSPFPFIGFSYFIYLYFCKLIITLIPTLFLLCSPSAISRFIIPIIINSIKGMILARSASHVFEKFLIGVVPAFTNFNPSSSIIMEVLVICVGASMLHMRPTGILSSNVSPCSIAMNYFHRYIIAWGIYVF